MIQIAIFVLSWSVVIAFITHTERTSRSHRANHKLSDEQAVRIAQLTYRAKSERERLFFLQLSQGLPYAVSAVKKALDDFESDQNFQRELAISFNKKSPKE